MFDVVVVYLTRHSGESTEILLGHKARGLGTGRLVGPGGKVLPGEDLKVAASREVSEEVGVTVSPEHLHHTATLTYPFTDRPENSQRSFVFTATEFSGIPAESEELAPAWYRLGDVPWGQMWDDAKLWLPRVLDGEFIEATFTIGPDDRVVDQMWAAH
jgi:8-oxo-dGTP diphosphatase